MINAQYRINKLGFSKYLAKLYAVEHHGLSHPFPERLREEPLMGGVRVLELHERKPDPRVLHEICRDAMVPPQNALYVGDSVARDVGMAREAGVLSAWAKYGTRYNPEHWNRLVRVTHWSEADVARVGEANRRYGRCVPDVVLENGFYELTDYFQFCSSRACE